MSGTYEPGVDSRPIQTPGTATSASQRRPFYDDPRRKSPVLALVLSGMPGLGQIYIGYYQQGFVNVIVAASIITILNSNQIHGGIEPLFGLFLAFFWLFNMVDAWRRAVFYNNALAGIGPATLPEDFTAPTGRGSLAAGVLMIAIGAVLLSNTLFYVPLDWLEKWWPAAFILGGVWLAFPNLLGKNKKGQA